MLVEGELLLIISFDSLSHGQIPVQVVVFFKLCLNIQQNFPFFAEALLQRK